MIRVIDILNNFEKLKLIKNPDDAARCQQVKLTEKILTIAHNLYLTSFTGVHCA